MKIFSRLVIFILLLPVVFFCGLYIYGTYMTARIESRQDALDERQEVLSTSGNGLGGEPGMKVIASEHSPDRYFWMDNEHLIFITAYKASAPKDVDRKFIWNVIDNEIKPIELDGAVICFIEGKLYHAKFPDSKALPNDKKNVERFESTLKELNDRWVVENVRDVEKVWPAPSDRFRQSMGRECMPRFELRPEFRAETGEPEFRLHYLPEWNWVLRLPPMGHEFPRGNTAETEFGFFEIEEEFYFGQSGIKVADLPDMSAYHINKIKLTYTSHLDSYLLTLSINNSGDEPYVAILNRDGGLTDVSWVSDWDGYNSHPVLSRKGLVWTGRDYREAIPSIYGAGSFIKLFDNGIHKYVHGSGYDLVLSPNGCVVAQSNRPKTTSGQRNLIVFDICNSTYGGTR